MAEKKVGPYVGVTGFMSRAEVNEALSVVPRDSTHRLMIGVLMSSKTLAGQTNKWPGRYPQKEAVADIFVDHPQALNLVHYSTDDPHTLLEQLVQVTELAGPHLDGFQLNIPWPNLHQLDDYRSLDYGSTHTIILQIGKDSVLDVGGTPEGMVSALENYVGVVDGVLFDPSGGRGEPFDPERAILYLSAIEDAGWNLGLGVAGGLGPHTNHLIKPVAKRFQDISIDAQGKLRDSGNNLDTEAMKRYLVNMLNILS